MSTTETIRDLTREEYNLFRRLIYAQSGINLGDQKMQLIRARLGRRLRTGRFSSYRAYYEYVKNDKSGQEMSDLIDAISTNTTHLFREKQHFDFLTQTLRKWINDSEWCARHRDVRIWSSACSSGEEPHSIAMAAHNVLRSAPNLELKILATDISTQIIKRAKAGVYEIHRLGTVPDSFRRRYFVRINQDGQACAQISPELQRIITFAHFNLMMEQFPFRRRFDMIFCRNVMIYFDRQTQETLVNKLTRHLQPGGYLLIGHSESLNPIQHALTYVQPTVYQRPA